MPFSSAVICSAVILLAQSMQGDALRVLGACEGLTGRSLERCEEGKSAVVCEDDEEALYGPETKGTCAILRSRNAQDIERICGVVSAVAAQNYCKATCGMCAEICGCEDGTPATGAACVVSGDNTCAACNTGYFLTWDDNCQEHAEECAQGEHQTQAPTETQDRVCAGTACTCSNGIAAQGSDCTDDGSESCTACDAEFYLSDDGICEPRTVCAAGEHETSNPNDGDRECTANTCVCPGGTAAGAGTAACETDNANICTECAGEFFLNGQKECQEWTVCEAGTMQSQPPSNTQDRVCQDAVCGTNGSCCDDDFATYGRQGTGNCAALREESRSKQRRVCAYKSATYATANDHCLHTCDSCPENCGSDTAHKSAVFCNRVDSCTYNRGAVGCSDGHQELDSRGHCSLCPDCDQSECLTSSGCTWRYIKGDCTQD